jgi:hypothetical protein
MFHRSYLISKETQSYGPSTSRTATYFPATVHIPAILPNRLISIKYTFEQTSRAFKAKK